MDWYALGVLIFEMLSGLPPFHEPDISPVVLYEKIAQGPGAIKWPAFHPNATDLILKFMERDPSKRFGNMQHGAGDVFAHPWFREVDWKKLLNREITAPYLPRIAGDGDASACVSVVLSMRRCHAYRAVYIQVRTIPGGQRRGAVRREHTRSVWRTIPRFRVYQHIVLWAAAFSWMLCTYAHRVVGYHRLVVVPVTLSSLSDSVLYMYFSISFDTRFPNPMRFTHPTVCIAYGSRTSNKDESVRTIRGGHPGNRPVAADREALDASRRVGASSPFAQTATIVTAPSSRTHVFVPSAFQARRSISQASDVEETTCSWCLTYSPVDVQL